MTNTQTPKLLYGEDLNYWQTGQRQPESWLNDAMDQIVALGGKVSASGFMTAGDQEVYTMVFTLKGDEYRVQFPVLPSRSGNVKAARRQAATMLFHDVKAKCLLVKVFGARQAFMPYWVLPNGQTMAQAVTAGLPMLSAPVQSGDVLIVE